MINNFLKKILNTLSFFGGKRSSKEKAADFAREKEEHQHKIPEKMIGDRFGRAIERLSDR